VNAANAAYILYTSGTTGRPNGVVVEHRALAHYALAAAEAFALAPHDRVLQFASLNFDTAAEEIYPCLARGATLVLRLAAMLDTPSIFLDMCRTLGLTVLDLPTAYWHELTRHLARTGVSTPEQLRLVVIGGEALHLERLRQWRRQVPGRVRLLNTYGPTETTVAATLCDLTGPAATAEEDARAASIGRPIRAVQAYILDARLQPVPVGAPGELYIGGAGLARGYLNRPDLTAERFVAHPFAVEPGARLFKTGDHARYRPDGQIEFLGRLDHQVKIRGYRIEPGEVEAALTRHPAVHTAAVVAREYTPGDRRLVAYLVADAAAGAEPTSESLRRFLEDRLPAYMIPAAFILLPELPLTPNGKLDRHALPAPDHAHLAADAPFVAPRTPAEESLAGIWAGVLRLDRVGVHDDFFALGGHSLLAMQIVARVREAFHVELPLPTLFRARTLASLAADIADLAGQLDHLLNPGPIGPARPGVDALSDADVDALLDELLRG